MAVDELLYVVLRLDLDSNPSLHYNSDFTCERHKCCARHVGLIIGFNFHSTEGAPEASGHQPLSESKVHNSRHKAARTDLRRPVTKGIFFLKGNPYTEIVFSGCSACKPSYGISFGACMLLAQL